MICVLCLDEIRRSGIEQGLQLVRQLPKCPQGRNAPGMLGMWRIVDQQSDPTAGVLLQSCREQSAAHDTDFFLVRGHQDRQRLRMVVVSTFQVLAQRRPMCRAAVHVSQARQLINEVTTEQQCNNQHECQLSDSNGPLMSSQLVDRLSA